MVVKAPLLDLYGKPIEWRDHSDHIIDVSNSGGIITKDLNKPHIIRTNKTANSEEDR